MPATRRTELRVVAGTSTTLPNEQIDTELAKDVWDVRRLPGVRFADHRSDHRLDFTSVPEAFRPVLKCYVAFRLARLSWSRARSLVMYLREFFLFVIAREPTARDFRTLSVTDIDAYRHHLKTTPNRWGRPKTDEHVWLCMSALSHFLRYLKRIASPLAPEQDIDRIIWPEHLGRRLQFKNKRKAGKSIVKFLPEGILQQLDQHLHELPKAQLPVVIVLRASGWRISDVLSLRYDTCLKCEFNAQTQADEYTLVGDIPKTHVLDHEIPITTEIATLIEAQRTLVQERYTDANNPKHYLFPAHTRPRQGRPLSSWSVQMALNRLAARCEIRGDDGQIFHFKTHAFRHTKAMDLLNRGMPLVMVQQWLAHLSPEMTLIYAHILADTMRKQWEQTEAKVGIRFIEGKAIRVEGQQLAGLLTNDAFHPARVREHRVNIKLPVGNCVKPKTFPCRFVELPCFNCPMYVLTDEDLPWLLTYELQLLERIEVGRQAGHAHWVEANQRLLDEKVRPALALLQQGRTLAREAQHVREYAADEWEQQQQQQELPDEEVSM